ncbi:hypothetical protein [Alkalihalobacillus sp. AL-G]|uniref:hypothetical protein n=1 Tax=Alkalihalobacillus sp. AL-G TaxID=2926399 RepID=UPI00272C1400|nr:hypothetical protein [Alkalihalobacillus sp. AL-G]WLD94501.1 hypothetical protein MOJ78_06335 [Alkalihalobacillus sp. AL-G]
MSKKLSLKEEIIDAIADGPRTLELFERYLRNFDLHFSRDEIIKQLSELLDDGMIIVGYPLNSKAEVSKSADDKEINDYWLELTERGREEQQKISF